MLKNRIDKKGQWTLEAVFGIAGLSMFIDAIWLKILLPANRFFEGFLGMVFILIAIVISINKRR